MRNGEMGGLRVRITGGTDREGGGDGPVIVLLHGFGAPGDDLVPLWRVIPAPAGTRFVFPEAPLSLAEAGYAEGRAWWMIDMERLIQRQRTGQVDEAKLRAEIPPGLEASRERVVAMLDEVEKTMSPSRIVLGGFSQGAMLACDVALRTERPLAGLVMLSGTLIAETEWSPLMAKRRGLQVLQSHGQSDALLPFSAAERLRDELTTAGLDVKWVPFRGGHEIPPNVREELGAFVTRVLTR